MLFPAIRRFGWNGLEKLEAGWNGFPTQIICWAKRQQSPCRGCRHDAAKATTNFVGSIYHAQAFRAVQNGWQSAWGTVA